MSRANNQLDSVSGVGEKGSGEPVDKVKKSNVLQPHPHRVCIMFVEHDACVGAHLTQARVAGDVTAVTTITARYHERTGYAVHWGPKRGEHEPEGVGGRRT